MGCLNIVIYLIQRGSNPDVPTVRGETPLHLAARANQTDIIRILLRNGAQVDARARVSTLIFIHGDARWQIYGLVIPSFLAFNLFQVGSVFFPSWHLWRNKLHNEALVVVEEQI